MSEQRGSIWPLLMLFTVIFLAYWAYWALPDATEDRYDNDILHSLAIMFGVWCLAMLIRTRLWSWLALAVLAAFLGDALFYAAVSGWYPDGYAQEWFYLMRACFTVSVTMLMGQLVWDVVMWARCRFWHRCRVSIDKDGLP